MRDVNKTLEWLEKAYVQKNARLVNLRVHPQFAFLRNEARFHNLVEKIWGDKLIAATRAAGTGR